MVQELATLCVSDMGRLLGTLVLLSVGITLTLWGLKHRRSEAVVIVLFLCLVALVPAALAIEIPPAGSVAQIQTNGPNTPLLYGDWYTSNNPSVPPPPGGPGNHSFHIYIPCTIAPTQTITVELFDPESFAITVPPTPPELDEIEPLAAPVSDTTMFTLTNPSGVVIATTTYTPTGGTSQNWTTFATFYPDPATNGCGIYRLTTSTSDDDQNGWRLRVTPDGTPGTGDEISLGNLETSFQHIVDGCQVFHFFVPVTPSIRLSNFDMDSCAICSVVYTTPIGTSIGSVSGNEVWNNGGGTGYPPPGGDPFSNPEPGWWQAALCLNDFNQYVFDAGGLPYFYEGQQPAAPDMTVSKDDGTATFTPGGMLTYTLTYTNAGPGAALNVVLTDTLPDYTTFVSCSGGLSCGYIPPPPGSGVVVFSLGTVAARTSGSVMVTVLVDPFAPAGYITNTVELDYTDVVFSDYPVETDTDVDQYVENPAIEIAKTPDSQTVVSGSTVAFTITVTNIGDVALSNVTVTDALAPTCATNLGILAAGASTSYICTVANVTADFTNTVAVTGTSPAGNDVTDGDDANVAVINPGIEIAKTPDVQTVVSGSTVAFTITVTNIGDVDLSNVTVSDALAPNCATNLGVLAVGASTSYICTVANVTADFTNTVMVTGTPPVGDDVTDSDTAFVDVSGPGIEIAKTPDLQTVVSGSTVAFTITVTNIGDVDLSNVTVTDALAPNCAANLGVLAVGASTSYICTVANVTADFTNTVTVTGTPPVGGDVTDSDTAFVDVSGPGIQIDKTVYLGYDGGASCPGSEVVTDTIGAAVTYCFEVTNTGDTYLDSIVITDIALGIPPDTVTLLVGMSDPYPPLAPGDSLVYYYEGTISGDLVNTAEAEGNPTDRGGNDLPGLDNPTDRDDAAVYIFELVDPAITKSGDPTVASPGEIVTFVLQVTNGGIADAHDVVVTDVIPEYLSIRSATSTKGTLTITGQTVVVDIGTIAGSNREVVVITIVTEVRAGTPERTVMENQASLVFTGGDRQSNIVYVEVPEGEPSEPGPPDEPRPPAPPPPPPPPTTPATPTLTPTVELLTVEMLPETGGLPGWFTVVLGVSIIIGAAGLLNLAFLGMRGRRGDGKGD